jgi:hypothetical protein
LSEWREQRGDRRDPLPRIHDRTSSFTPLPQKKYNASERMKVEKDEFQNRCAREPKMNAPVECVKTVSNQLNMEDVFKTEGVLSKPGTPEFEDHSSSEICFQLKLHMCSKEMELKQKTEEGIEERKRSLNMQEAPMALSQ